MSNKKDITRPPYTGMSVDEAKNMCSLVISVAPDNRICGMCEYNRVCVGSPMHKALSKNTNTNSGDKEHYCYTGIDFSAGDAQRHGQRPGTVNPRHFDNGGIVDGGLFNRPFDIDRGELVIPAREAHVAYDNFTAEAYAANLDRDNRDNVVQRMQGGLVRTEAALREYRTAVEGVFVSPDIRVEGPNFDLDTIRRAVARRPERNDNPDYNQVWIEEE